VLAVYAYPWTVVPTRARHGRHFALQTRPLQDGLAGSVQSSFLSHSMHIDE
jgi:hypothetical protein